LNIKLRSYDLSKTVSSATVSGSTFRLQLQYIHCVQKKTPTHICVHISMSDV